MKNNAWIGIDLGTSGCRAIAINQQADIIATARITFPPASSQPPQSEQDPYQQWQIVRQVLHMLVAQCRQYQIQSIAVDATSGSVLLTDLAGKALTPILLYNDARSVNAAKLIEKIAPVESAAHGASSGLAKLIHVAETNDLPEQYKLLHQADWINFNLGAPLAVTDYNNALKTGYDAVALCWPEWISTVTPMTVLPDVVAPGTIIGQLSDELCAYLQIESKPELVAGTTDSIAALLASGASQNGDGVTSLGSTLVLKLISEHPVFNSEAGIYSHRLGQSWLIGGASNSGGAVLRQYFNDEQLGELSERINLNQTAPDYYPLTVPGERFPLNDANLQPRLSPRPDDDAEFLYGMLAGMARIEALGYNKMQQLGASPLSSIRTMGGGAKNKVWQQIRQRYLPVPFIDCVQHEAAFGSALLAKNGLSSFNH